MCHTLLTWLCVWTEWPILFPSDSESESRVKDSGGLGNGIESPWETGLKAEGILGYSILRMENREKPVILVMQD
jgi:hypothetical protein